MAIEDVIEQVREWEGKLSSLKKRTGEPRRARDHEVGEALGFSGSYIQRLRRGKRELTLSVIDRISKRYKKSWATIERLYKK